MSGLLALTDSVAAAPNLVFAREQGAIAAVLSAMEQNPDHGALQAQATWALLVFCSNESWCLLLNFWMVGSHLTLRIAAPRKLCIFQAMKYPSSSPSPLFAFAVVLEE